MFAKEIAIFGAGTMGTGITQVAATHGATVRLIDTMPDAVERAKQSIAERLQRQVNRGSMSEQERTDILGRILEGSIDNLDGVDFVIEAIIEDLGVKSELFQSIDATAPENAVLATNTSSLSVSDIAKSVNDPSRLVGMHFFNPAPVMSLVEIVVAEASAPTTVDFVVETASTWGKVPARTKDTPGFIVNRVARTSYVEAFRMLDEGIAGPEQIDGAMRTLGQFRMGPLQIADLVGQEVNHAVTVSVWEQSGRPVRFEPPKVQAQLVERGELGQKTNAGVYDYGTEPPTENITVETQPLVLPDNLALAVDEFVQVAALCEPETIEYTSIKEHYVFARILGSVMNEAALALSDNVATAEDIDVALQRATNYPRGPVEWGHDVGYPTLGRLLLALDSVSGDDRFMPAPLIIAEA
jgi:3-hydroxybutyryl-CoA dehydrogenase